MLRVEDRTPGRRQAKRSRSRMRRAKRKQGQLTYMCGQDKPSCFS
jgi:hypothetical protein